MLWSRHCSLNQMLGDMLLPVEATEVAAQRTSNIVAIAAGATTVADSSTTSTTTNGGGAAATNANQPPTTGAHPLLARYRVIDALLLRSINCFSAASFWHRKHVHTKNGTSSSADGTPTTSREASSLDEEKSPGDDGSVEGSVLGRGGNTSQPTAVQTANTASKRTTPGRNKKKKKKGKGKQRGAGRKAGHAGGTSAPGVPTTNADTPSAGVEASSRAASRGNDVVDDEDASLQKKLAFTCNERARFHVCVLSVDWVLGCLARTNRNATRKNVSTR